MGTQNLKNTELCKVVIETIVEAVEKRDPIFKRMGNNDPNFILDFVSSGMTEVDESYKIRHNSPAIRIKGRVYSFIGQGYDFRESNEVGTSGRELYEGARNKLNGENVIYSEIKEGRYGLLVVEREVG